jgi:hypothetical protein
MNKETQAENNVTPVNDAAFSAAEKTEAEKIEAKAESVTAVEETPWGVLPADNFGYASDEERRAKRGLEDWEMIDAIPEAQLPVPRWFIGIIVAVVMVAVGLSFPFWGDRPGYEREWINWGFGAALLYIAVFGAFVYFMVNFYGSKIAGRLDNDKLSDKSINENKLAKAQADVSAEANPEKMTQADDNENNAPLPKQ